MHANMHTHALGDFSTKGQSCGPILCTSSPCSLQRYTSHLIEPEDLTVPQIIKPSHEALNSAASQLRAGGVVAFPTETVYGLGASTFNAAALGLIYQLKGRPFENPLIAHVTDWEQAKTQLVSSQTQDRMVEMGAALAREFWPGPLTLVMPKSDRVPLRATAGLSTIALRSPAHPVAQEFLKAFGGPISAPSANRSGHVSPTTAQHVADDFADARDLLILDGGQSQVGIESTVLDLTTRPPRILRAGQVTLEQLQDVIGEVDATRVERQDASPGTSARHYAPRSLSELLSRDELKRRLDRAAAPAAVLTMHPTDVAAPHRAITMPREAEEYARVLYDSLRRADSLDMGCILIEEPPRESGLWAAIHDRLRRATTSA